MYNLSKITFNPLQYSNDILLENDANLNIYIVEETVELINNFNIQKGLALSHTYDGELKVE